MNIFSRELRSYIKFILIWALSLSALSALFLAMYPAFTKDMAASRQVLENFPLAFREAMGVTSIESFFNVDGFTMYLLGFAVIAGGVQAMNIGVGIISKENALKTADFLLSKPVSRNRIITEKLLAGLVALITTNVIFVGISLAIAKMVSTAAFSSKTFILLLLNLFLIQLFFWALDPRELTRFRDALGSFLAVVIPKIKSVIAVSLPIVFAFYIIGMLDSVLGVSKVRYITPFKFYDLLYVMKNNSYEPKFLILEAVYIVVLLTLTFVIFNKKDTHSAT